MVQKEKPFGLETFATPKRVALACGFFFFSFMWLRYARVSRPERVVPQLHEVKLLPSKPTAQRDGDGVLRRRRSRIQTYPVPLDFEPDLSNFKDLDDWYLSKRPNVQVFAAGDGAPCYRIPAIVVTAKGTLLAFAEARWGVGPARCTDRSAQEISVRRSTTFGRTWEPVWPISGGPNNPIGNPVAISLRCGRVIVVFHYHPVTCTRPDCGGEGRGNGIVISDDDGVSWSPERNITHDFAHAANGMPGPGAGIQLSSGRLLVISHMGPYIRDEVSYSDDEGQTWISTHTDFEYMDEATFAEVGENEVLLIMRHQGETIEGKAYARSLDGGMTWSVIDVHQSLVGPVCQASLASLGNGVLLFANPATPYARNMICIKASIDGGRSWRVHLVVERENTFGYTSLVNGFVVKERMLTGILFEASEKGDIDYRIFRYNTTRALQARSRQHARARVANEANPLEFSTA